MYFLVRFLEVPASMNIVFRNALFVQAYFCRIELPHYNYLKMLRTAIPFALSLALPPVFHTLHFISGCPILSTAMEDELQITLTKYDEVDARIFSKDDRNERW